jgi:hypothetical protein
LGQRRDCLDLLTDDRKLIRKQSWRASQRKETATSAIDPYLPWQGSNFVRREFFLPEQLLGVESGNASYFNRVPLSLRKRTSVFQFKSSAWPVPITQKAIRMAPLVPPG